MPFSSDLKVAIKPFAFPLHSCPCLKSLVTVSFNTASCTYPYVICAVQTSAVAFNQILFTYPQTLHICLLPSLHFPPFLYFLFLGYVFILSTFSILFSSTHFFLPLPSSSRADTKYLYFLIITVSFLLLYFSPVSHLFLLFYVYPNLKYYFFILWLLFFTFIFFYSHLLLNSFCYLLSFLCTPLFNFTLVLHIHAIYLLVSNIT